MLGNTFPVRITPMTLHIPSSSLFLDIANYIYEHPGVIDLDLQGVWIADRKYRQPMNRPDASRTLPTHYA